MGRIEPVTRPDRLEALVEELRSKDAFGLDLEFSAEKTYFARLELVQVAADGVEAIVDPLALDDLRALWELVADPSIETVVHAGDQDLAIVYEASGLVPANVFDTQIAASLVGFGEQISYGDLVRKLLGDKLAKHHARADWSTRPLPEDQATYALDDVRYLLRMRERLAGQLREAGRETWADEEMAHLAEEETYVFEPSRAYRSVRKRGGVRGESMAVLRELAAWREEEARRRDLPRRWVVADDVLVDLARRAPTDPEGLRGLRRFPEKLADRYEAELLEAVARGKAAEVPKAKPRPSAATERAAELAAALVRIRAQETGVAASVLAPRRSIDELVRWVIDEDVPEEPDLMRGWRRELIGDEIADLVAGRVVLRFEPAGGSVVAEPR